MDWIALSTRPYNLKRCKCSHVHMNMLFYYINVRHNSHIFQLLCSLFCLFSFCFIVFCQVYCLGLSLVAKLMCFLIFQVTFYSVVFFSIAFCWFHLALLYSVSLILLCCILLFFILFRHLGLSTGLDTGLNTAFNTAKNDLLLIIVI